MVILQVRHVCLLLLLSFWVFLCISRCFLLYFRYAVSVMCQLDDKCKIKELWFGRTVIRSAYKLTYEVSGAKITTCYILTSLSVVLYLHQYVCCEVTITHVCAVLRFESDSPFFFWRRFVSTCMYV